jgi:hypothetical protein
MSRIPLMASVLALLFAVSSSPLHAAGTTFTVTRTDDPIPDACVPGDCSLREAALAANANDEFADADRIELAAGSYVLVRGTLSSNQDLEIVGAGSSVTQISTDAGLFGNLHDHTLTVRGVSLQTTDFNILAIGDHGRLVLEEVLVPAGGGSVQASGDDSTLEAHDSEFRDGLQCNQASGSCTIVDSGLFSLYVNPAELPGPDLLMQRSTLDGSLNPAAPLPGRLVLHAGTTDIEDSTIIDADGFRIMGSDSQHVTLLRVHYIDNTTPIYTETAATVTIDDSEFRGNTSRAIKADAGGTWIVRGSSFVDNRVDGNAGGAVVVEGGATLRVENSTFSGNLFTVGAAEDGARGEAIGYRGDSGGAAVVLRHVTIVPPTFSPVGVEGTAIGGFDGASVDVDISNSIIRGSCRFDGSALRNHTNNIESPGNSCGFDAGTSQVSVPTSSVALGTLGDHGGPTPTYEPDAESVAVDAGGAQQCLDTDQRGYERPAGDGCDIGAVEVGAHDTLFADGFD